MARECMQKIQSGFENQIDNLISGLDNICPELGVTEKQEIMVSKLLASMGINETTINFLKQIQETNLTSVFEDARYTGISTKANLAYTSFAEANSNYKTILTKTSQLINYESENRQIFQSKKKMISNKIVNCTGVLPQSEDVFSVMHFSEGDRITEDFICPSFEGGEIFVIGLRPRIMDVAIENDVIKNVGTPAMLFLLRTERVVQSSEGGGLSDTFTSEKIQIKTAFTTCLQSTNIRILPSTVVCHNPFTNVATNNYGHICLGSMRQSFLVTFNNAAEMDRFPASFINGGSSTHHYSTKFKTFKGMNEYATKCQGVQFPPSELIEAYSLEEWITGCINTMTGK